MLKMRKGIALIVAMVICVLLLAGCGNQESSKIEEALTGKEWVAVQEFNNGMPPMGQIYTFDTNGWSGKIVTFTDDSLDDYYVNSEASGTYKIKQNEIELLKKDNSKYGALKYEFNDGKLKMFSDIDGAQMRAK